MRPTKTRYIFALLTKSRNQIEVMFDGIKNILHADRTYMQNENALQGWMFINHITLQWCYQIYNLVKIIQTTQTIFRQGLWYTSI